MYKFYRKGDYWIYNDSPHDDKEITVPAGYYRRITEGNIVSVIGINTHTNTILREVDVTLVSKNIYDDKYTDIDDFITATDPFFIDPNTALSKDLAGRDSFNSVFGESITGYRNTDVAAQFQYGYPTSDAIPEITGTGNIYINESILYVSTGSSSGSLGAVSNKRALRYIPGHEAYIFFTAIFSNGVIGSSQRGGFFDADDGYYIGFEGDQFGYTRRRDGVNYFTPIDTSTVFQDGNFDPTNGNVYKISYGYLGFADIRFEVLRPERGWVNLGTIGYAGRHDVTHITNTNLPPRMEVENTTNDTEIILGTASFSAGVVGSGNDPNARRKSLSLLDQTITEGTFDLALFRNKDTFYGKENHIEGLLTLLSISTDLNKSAIVTFVRNPTIANTPTWTDVETNSSITEYSTDAITTGGEEIVSFAIAKVDTFFEKLEDQRVALSPTETMAIRIITPGGAVGTVSLSMRWKELF